MTTEDDIVYKGKSYPVRIITLSKQEGTRRVSTIALEEALMSKDGEFRGEAEKIDDTIYYYLTPEEWELSDKQLLKEIKGNGG